MESRANGDDTESNQKLLFSQCELGNKDVVAKLLAGRRSLFVNCVDANGNTPLHKCLDADCAGLVLQHAGADYGMLNRQNRRSQTPLMVAILADNREVAEFLIDNGADIQLPNSEFQLPLHVAAHVGCVEILAKILQLANCDVNQSDRQGNTALHYAAQHADKTKAEQMVQRLLQEKLLNVDATDSCGRSAFILSSQAGNIGVCRLLRDAGCHLARGDSNGANALHVAAAASDPDVVEFLVRDMQFCVDQVDGIGRSALFYAAHHRCPDNFAVLLQLGASFELRDRVQRTPIHVCSQRGADECLRLLLATTAASVEAEDNVGQRPLHLAAAAGRYTTVKLLLKHMRQRQHKQLGQGDALVEKVTAKDAEGRTALELAQAAGHKQICDLLKAVVAEANSRPQSAAHGPINEAKLRRKQQKQLRWQQQQKKQNSNKPPANEEAALRAYPRPWSASDERARRLQAQQSKMSQKENNTGQLQQEKQRQDDQEHEQQKQEEQEQEQGEESQQKEDHQLQQKEEQKQQEFQEEQRPSSVSSSSSTSTSSHNEPKKHKTFLEMELEPYADEEDDPYVSRESTWITRDPKEEKEQSAKGQGNQKTRAKSADERQRQRAASAKQPVQKQKDNLAELRRSQREFDRIRLLGRQEAKRRQARIRNRQTNHRLISVTVMASTQTSYDTNSRRQRPASAYADDAEILHRRFKDLNSSASLNVDKSRSNNRSLADSLNSMSRVSSARSPRSRKSRSSSRSPAPPAYRPPQRQSKFLEYFTNTLPQAGQQRQASARGHSRQKNRDG